MSGERVNGTRSRAGAAERAPLSRGLLPTLLGYHLRRAQTAVFKDFAEVVGVEEDITPGLFGMLQVIAANAGLSQSRLAEAMDVDRSTIVTVVDRLEARGLVERLSSLHDRRSHSLCVTTKGARAMARMERLVLRHEATFASVLSADERETLVRLLARLYDRRGADASRPREKTRTRRSER